MPSISTSLLSLLAVIAVLSPVKAAPTIQNGAGTFSGVEEIYTVLNIRKEDALAAQKLNEEHAKLKASDRCINESLACIDLSLSTCRDETWELSSCNDLSCFAFPMIGMNGTAVGCNTAEDTIARFEAVGVVSGINGTDTSTSTMTDDCSSTSDASLSISQTSVPQTSTETFPSFTSSAPQSTTESGETACTVTITITSTVIPSSTDEPAPTVTTTPATTVFTTTTVTPSASS